MTRGVDGIQGDSFLPMDLFCSGVGKTLAAPGGALVLEFLHACCFVVHHVQSQAGDRRRSVAQFVLSYFERPVCFGNADWPLS